MLENIAAIEDLPVRHKDNLFVLLSKTDSMNANIRITQFKTMLKCIDSCDDSICIAQPKTMSKGTNSMDVSICIAT